MALVGHISGSTQSNSVIGISGSVIVANRPQALFPAMPGTDVKFFVSGSSTATPSDVALFGGDLMSSGSFNLKSGTGGISQFSVNSTGLSISTAVGAQMITLASSNGLITTAGDIAVNGGDITTTSASATLFNSTATTVSIAAAGTSVSIGSAVGTGTTTVNNSLTGKGTNNNIDMLNVTGSAGLSVTRNVVISGDLTVNGAMTTVNTTNLEVKDSVIGLGFASGTIAQTAGDRGWIGGQAGTNNVMSKWDNTASEFAFATTTSSATGSFGIAAYSNLHAANIQGSIISASLGFSGSHTKLMDGTSAFIGGTGVSITSQSNGAVTISTTGGSTVAGSDTWVQYNNAGAFGANADFTFNNSSKLLRVSGSFSQGDNTTAFSDFSHAEGQNSLAMAMYSHAEGSNSVTNAVYSHAEGVLCATYASGSHAEGYSSFTYGEGAHAEGYQTVASGTYSHTEGQRTIASGSYQTVIGKYNLRGNTDSLFVIGNGFGDADAFRSDVFRVKGDTNTARAEVTGSFAATLGLSGSHTKLVDGTSAFIAGTGITIASASNGAVTISTTGGSTVAGSDTQIQYNNGGAFGADADFTFTAASNLLSVPNITTAVISGSSGNLTIFGALGDNNTLNLGTNTATTVNVGGALTNVNVGPTSGDITLDGTGGGTVYVKAANLLPYADVSLNLGSPSRRWANIYTGDLHLRNDRGDYTLIEEEDFLTIRFNKSGKRYKFLLERVPELDEDPILNLK